MVLAKLEFSGLTAEYFNFDVGAMDSVLGRPGMTHGDAIDIRNERTGVTARATIFNDWSSMSGRTVTVTDNDGTVSTPDSAPGNGYGRSDSPYVVDQWLPSDIVTIIR